MISLFKYTIQERENVRDAREKEKRESEMSESEGKRRMNQTSWTAGPV